MKKIWCMLLLCGGVYADSSWKETTDSIYVISNEDPKMVLGVWVRPEWKCKPLVGTMEMIDANLESDSSMVDNITTYRIDKQPQWSPNTDMFISKPTSDTVTYVYVVSSFPTLLSNQIKTGHTIGIRQQIEDQTYFYSFSLVGFTQQINQIKHNCDLKSSVPIKQEPDASKFFL